MRIFSHIVKKIKFIPKVGIIVATFLIPLSNISFGQTTMVVNREQFNTNPVPSIPAAWTAGSWNLNYNYVTNTHDYPTPGLCEPNVASIATGNIAKYFWIPVTFTTGYQYNVDIWRKNCLNMTIVFNETADLTTPLSTETKVNATAAWQQITFTSWTSNYSGSGYIGICVATGNASRYYVDDITISSTALEPTAHPGTFTATASATCTQIDLSFPAAITVGSYAKGYLILQRQGADPTGVPTDGNAYSVGTVIGDATVVANVSNAAATSATIASLAGLTNYHYSIIPYNYNGSNASSYNYKTTGFITANATTISCGDITTEPSNHPATFSVIYSNNCKELNLSFSAASTISNCYGYLILRKQGSASSATPNDQNAYTVGSSISDATVVANITNASTTSLAETALANGAIYYYSIFPYNYDGSMATSYNYKTTGYLSGNATTIFCEALIGSSAGGDNPGSGYDDPSIMFYGANSNWWAVNLYSKNEMHNEANGSKGSSVHNVISSICVDLHPDDPHWTPSTKSVTMSNNKIYMANYSDVYTLPSEYTSESALNTGVGVTWTEVYSGDITFSGWGWNQIALSTPFYYNGTGSLLVKFTRTSGSTDFYYPLYGYLSASPTSNIRQLNSSYNTPGSKNPASYKYLKICFNSKCENGEILPIELSSFNGKCDGDVIDISWATASETNNDFFTVEKSTDAQNWHVMITMDGAGNSNETLNYSITDENPGTQRNYYRLKQTDYDGKYSYSDIISVVPCVDDYFDMIVAGNPVNNALNLLVSSSDSQKVAIHLKDMLGRTVYSGINNVIKGDNSVQIDVHMLSNGVYILCAEPQFNGIPVVKEILINN